MLRIRRKFQIKTWSICFTFNAFVLKTQNDNLSRKSFKKTFDYWKHLSYIHKKLVPTTYFVFSAGVRSIIFISFNASLKSWKWWIYTHMNSRFLAMNVKIFEKVTDESFSFFSDCSLRENWNEISKKTVFERMKFDFSYRKLMGKQKKISSWFQTICFSSFLWILLFSFSLSNLFPSHLFLTKKKKIQFIMMMFSF